MDTKICTRCKKEKFLDQFINTRNAEKECCVCLSCRKEHAEYYKKHKEEIRKNANINKELYNSNRRKVRNDNIEDCRKKAREYYRNNTQSILYHAAKTRAKKNNLAFNIDKDDVTIPEYCPILGVRLTVANGYAHDCSPSLDRIIPSKGYVNGNIIVISHKANSIKNNATVEELKKVYGFYKNLLREMKNE